MADTVLEVRNLVKRFDGATILDGLSLTIGQGEVLVIIGPSGCGKSTLLRCINGLESLDGGDIFLQGEKVSGLQKNVHLVRQKIGMVFQSYELFPHMDVMGNLLLGPTKALGKKKAEVEEEALRLLDRVGLKDRAHALPRQLSGGQKQRVAIVRALLMHPQLLLLDEITAALDPEMVNEVLRVVLDLAKDGMTMAIVTHEMRFAEAVGDRIIFLEEGRIVEESEPKAFFAAPKTERAQQFLRSFSFSENG